MHYYSERYGEGFHRFSLEDKDDDIEDNLNNLNSF
jgi:hypothetical protein